MLLTTILISSCAREGAFIKSREMASCGEVGGTFVNLFYSNAQIKTAATAHVVRGEDFKIRLKPKNDSNNRPGIDYRTETVTVSGKDADSAWLSASGSYNSTSPPHHELVICVPPDQPDGNYYYQIEINEAGKLDPRANVY